MLASYHNHTTWSDGKSRLDEVVAAARRLNIAELGVSDHFVAHPRGVRRSWAMPFEALDPYIHELRAAREMLRAGGEMNLRIGLEVDWFPGHAQPIREAIADFEFDYLIGSVHEVDGFLVDTSPAAWEALTQEERNRIHRQYWVNMRTLAASGLFHVAAHLDLPKKFGYLATIDLSREIADALDAIAEAGVVIELNTAGWHKPVNDAYPSLEILREARRRDVRVTISADAHLADHLIRDFDRAAERLREAGFSEVARFAEGRVRSEPLDEAMAAAGGGPSRRAPGP